MVGFGGWDMPVQYQGILDEYQAVRQRVGIFDICHMGEFLLHGSPLSTGLDRLVTQSLTDLPSGSCRYGFLLNESGGVLDDLIIFRLAQERWMLVVNAATAERDAKHIRSFLDQPDAFEDISQLTGKIDVQGPASRDFLKSWVEDIERLDYYTCKEYDIFGCRVLISRTGYTGELGYELYLPWDSTRDVWESFLKAGALPAGLGARDILRIEVGYPLYGHELDEEHSPLTAGMSRLIDWQKEFIGSSALKTERQNGITEKIVTVAAENRRSPRAGQPVLRDGRGIGVVTSGTFSPCLQRGVALARVSRDGCSLGDAVEIGTDRRPISGEVVPRKVYTQGTLNS